ncbi:MAG: DUF423 domain-containing protein [Leptolyngbyaceae cyanobacterium bins.59]|nr:DUF423 domain-containing protein [Leptolyngbyaceae cyanobacterium bins.59]
MMVKGLIFLAGLLGAMAVGAGAFGSHALKGKLTDQALQIFEVGVRYQMYHVLALLLVGIWLTQAPTSSPFLLVAGYCFLAGIAIFSGSLYALSLTGIKWLGTITPLGGFAFMAGWVCVAIAALKLTEIG